MQTKEAMESKPVCSITLWTLLKFLTLGACPEFLHWLFSIAGCILKDLMNPFLLKLLVHSLITA